MFAQMANQCSLYLFNIENAFNNFRFSRLRITIISSKTIQNFDNYVFIPGTIALHQKCHGQ